MRIFLLLMTLICSMPAWSDEVTLFGKFYYGQPKNEILRMEGVTVCRESPLIICRRNRSFVGFDGWVQAFLFHHEKLGGVVMVHEDSDLIRFYLFNFLNSSGFVIAHFRANSKGQKNPVADFDVIQSLFSKGVEATWNEMRSIEKKYYKENGEVFFMLLPSNIIKRELVERSQFAPEEAIPFVLFNYNKKRTVLAFSTMDMIDKIWNF